MTQERCPAETDHRATAADPPSWETPDCSPHPPSQGCRPPPPGRPQTAALILRAKAADHPSWETPHCSPHPLSHTLKCSLKCHISHCYRFLGGKISISSGPLGVKHSDPGAIRSSLLQGMHTGDAYLSCQGCAHTWSRFSYPRPHLSRYRTGRERSAISCITHVSGTDRRKRLLGTRAGVQAAAVTQCSKIPLRRQKAATVN